MIAMFLLVGVFTAMSILLPPVTELPWGLEEPLSIFMNQVNLILAIFPPLQVVWQVFLIALTVKMALYALEILWRVIQLIRG